MLKEMSRAALSVFIFGIYIIFLAITFLIFPEMMFTILDISTDPDIASRVLGMIFLFLAYYYIRAAFEGLENFFMWTVHTRGLVIVFLIVFSALELVSPLIIVFGVIDFAFAAWTFWELHKEKG